MAEVSGDRMITCDSDVPTHVTHMSRLMTMARPDRIRTFDLLIRSNATVKVDGQAWNPLG